MNGELKFLLLEDDDADAELIRSELRKSELRFSLNQVKSRDTFEERLRNHPPGLVLIDYAVPGFDALAALRMVQEIKSQAPCIVISDAAGEDVVIETLKKGATDYVLRNRMSRLVPAVQRALRDSKHRADLKEAENQIREQARLLNFAQDAIIQVDLEDQVRFWSHGAHQLYGWSAMEAAGKSLPDLLFRNTDDYARARAGVEARDEWTGEMRQQNNQGKHLIVQSRWAMVRDGNNRPKSILMVNSDVTEKKKIEAQLFRAQRMQSIGLLAGGIAHDLNNILAPILMAAESLERKVSDLEARKLISTIESSAERGAAIVKHVLMFARGVEGVHRVVPAEDLIADIRKILEETFPKSIRIEFDTQPGLAALYGDATQFEQVLLNLCVNARDAMPLGGTLSIRAQNARPGPGSADARTDECVEIRVTDTGSGMPAEHLRKIFEPFFTTKAAGQGTGLGLSMVQTIVESHGGTVRVESKVGKGTTFIIRLPSLEGVEPKQKAQRPAELPPGHGECILVVDDEASIREMTKEMLNTFGYEVLTAGDGAEAKTVFTENHRRVGAVLVDMIMPVMEGPDCMAALRSIDPGVKIILTSGSEEHRKYCANGGDCTFLAKPYSAEKLLSTVHQAIAQSTH